MVVAVGRGHLIKGTPAVNGLPGEEVQDPDRVGVLRVGEDVAVVPGTALQLPFIGDALPGVAGVVGAVEAALLGL